jgi:phospholipase C
MRRAGNGRWAAGGRLARRAALAAVVLALAPGTLSPGLTSSADAASLEGIHKIQHVIVIMQENRSFDSYFGTYPGANGIPAGVCVPDPADGGCVAPFHDPEDKNSGGPHGHGAFVADLDEGRMDGFVGEAEKGSKCSSTEPGCSPCTEQGSSAQGGSGASSGSASASCVDPMGYHDAREIPNYWMYAQNFVLQDAMFEPISSWSWPEHLTLVSAWSASCKSGEKWSENPLSCFTSLEGPPAPEEKEGKPNPYTGPEAISLPWTDITYLLHKHEVSWGYYIFEGDEPDCEDDEAMTCAPVAQGPKTPGIWNPLVDFLDVKEDNQMGNVQSLTHFYTAVQKTSECALPNVSWVVPNSVVSEHPPALISQGQAYVTTLVNSIMRSPCWDSSAIFLSWDDWGGFYDHVVPPVIDNEGYGFRVPGLVISPYAKAGYVDHQQLSHESYLKFVEDDFLEDERLNPATDGRRDSRKEVYEEAPGVGNLESDFDFEQPPRPPLILSPEPVPGPASCPPGSIPSGAALPGPLSPCPYPTPPVPSPASSSPSIPSTSTPSPSLPVVAPELVLQLVASVAARQDMRLHHGRVYLTVSCNVTCLLYAHGHLSLLHHHRHLGLRGLHTTLAANRAEQIELSLSHSTEAALRRALREHHRVKALIDVDVSAAGQASRSYLVQVQLSYR